MSLHLKEIITKFESKVIKYLKDKFIKRQIENLLENLSTFQSACVFLYKHIFYVNTRNTM